MNVREQLARDGKLEAVVQACAAQAARTGSPFFVIPQGMFALLHSVLAGSSLLLSGFFYD